MKQTNKSIKIELNPPVFPQMSGDGVIGTDDLLNSNYNVYIEIPKYDGAAAGDYITMYFGSPSGLQYPQSTTVLNPDDDILYTFNSNVGSSVVNDTYPTYYTVKTASNPGVVDTSPTTDCVIYQE